jgi:Na+-translocating ferredoxin:NAD+ oxidoreductase RnfG subunit
VRARAPVILALALLAPAPLRGEEPELAEQVFLSRDEALAEALPGAGEVRVLGFELTPEEAKAVETRLGWPLAERRYDLFVGRRAGETSGMAFILDEVGKYYPITFVVGLGPAGSIERVAVMVYRERVGVDVRRQRFLKQFRGKGPGDPLAVNRDIVHLTGATISSWAVTAGVRRAVMLAGAARARPGFLDQPGESLPASPPRSGAR